MVPAFGRFLAGPFQFGAFLAIESLGCLPGLLLATLAFSASASLREYGR